MQFREKKEPIPNETPLLTLSVADFLSGFCSKEV
jgi:hypothetical protein